MFTPSDRHQSSRLYATHRVVDQGSYGIIPGQRIMAPPSSNGIPQPIEVDLSRPYPPWNASAYPLGPLEDPDPSLSSSSSPNKQLNVHDFGTRRAPDSLETWYTGNDGPWIPKGTVPEATHDDRSHVREPYTGYRNAGYGPPVGTYNRPADVLDNGNLHYGIPPPSDSGYGTRRSLENASVRSCEMTQSGFDKTLVDHNLDVRPYGEDGPSSREPLTSNSWTAIPVGIEVKAPVPGRCCETCGAEVKTKSELKKHILRHTKPYHCEVQQCERKEGYSTSNDLERHMISKHPNMFPGGKPPKTYRCMVLQCKSTDKNWPRLDNFRSHLKRIHHLGQDQINYQIRSNVVEHQQRIEHSRDESLDQVSETPDDGNNLPGHSEEAHTAVALDDAISWTSEKISQFERSEPAIDPTLEEPCSQQAFVTPTKIDPTGINRPQDLELLDQNALRQSQPQGKMGCLEDAPRHLSSKTLESTLPPIINETITSLKPISSEDVGERGKAPKRTKTSREDSELREAITAVLKAKIGQAGGSHHSSHKPQNGQFVGPSELTPATTLVRPGDIHHVCLPSNSMNLATISDKYTALTPKEDNNIQLTEEVLEAIKKAGFVLRRECKSSGSSGGDCSSASFNNKRSENIKHCTICNRFKGRPCELKKHMKRHERPYGCTFPKCKKAFGSKNDWKRHEITQHDQSELWRCDEPSCSKVFYQSTPFKTHLIDVHNITDQSIIEPKIDGSRIGSNYQAHFWCGFCENVINLNQKGTDAWTERFNHIDDHFMGRNGNKGQSILEWRHADGDDIEGVQVSLIEDCSEDSTSSGTSNSSSDSSPKSESPPTEVVSMPQKRVRDSSSDETKQHLPKKIRYNKYVICCHCDVQFSPKVYASCLDCEHEWCGSCNKISEKVSDEDYL